jgi:hypothetical protein
MSSRVLIRTMSAISETTAATISAPEAGTTTPGQAGSVLEALEGEAGSESDSILMDSDDMESKPHAFVPNPGPCIYAIPDDMEPESVNTELTPEPCIVKPEEPKIVKELNPEEAQIAITDMPALIAADCTAPIATTSLALAVMPALIVVAPQAPIAETGELAVIAQPPTYVMVANNEGEQVRSYHPPLDGR